MPDDVDIIGNAPFIAPTFDPQMFEGIDFTGVPATRELDKTPGQTVSQPVSPITTTDVSRLTDENQKNILRIISDLQSRSSFGGPGVSDLQTLRNILTPRTATVTQSPSIAPGLQTAFDVQRAQMIGDTRLGLQKKMLDQLFGGGQGPLINRIIESLGGLLSGGTSELPAGQNLQVGNIVKAMQALNAENAKTQQEALTNQFASLGRSPASTVLGDLKDRIARSQSLANIQGAGEIERLLLPIQQQRERIAAEFTQQRERIMESFVQNLLNQVLGGSFGLASSVGG